MNEERNSGNDDAKRVMRLQKLREPFPPEAIGLLPKPHRKDSPKGHCQVCGGYHGLPAAHLSYVGHAALTNVLLDVDPFWTWEPFGVDQNGLPLFDKSGGLWIKLTVCGVTRPGYGDAEMRQGKSLTKEIIGDAIRNAAMRFGAALEFWHKGKLPPPGWIDTGDDDAPNNTMESANFSESAIPDQNEEVRQEYVDRFLKAIEQYVPGKFSADACDKHWRKDILPVAEESLNAAELRIVEEAFDNKIDEVNKAWEHQK